MKTRAILVGLLLLLPLVIGCGVPYSLVREKHVVAQENFSIDLPEGWRQHNLSAIDQPKQYLALLQQRRKLDWDIIRLTRDGLLLQQIGVGRIPLEDELPNTKRKLNAEMLPAEVAALIIDELRSNSNLGAQQILEDAPATVGGWSGFRLHYTYRFGDLKFEGLFYGATTSRRLYYIVYEAPAQYYFAKDRAVVERMVSSFEVRRQRS
jgi:hypothetical protein